MHHIMSNGDLGLQVISAGRNSQNQEAVNILIPWWQSLHIFKVVHNCDGKRHPTSSLPISSLLTWITKQHTRHPLSPASHIQLCCVWSKHSFLPISMLALHGADFSSNVSHPLDVLHMISASHFHGSGVNSASFQLHWVTQLCLLHYLQLPNRTQSLPAGAIALE